MSSRSRWLRAVSSAVVTTLLAASATLIPLAAPAAAADVANPTTASSDALPTVQVDGVVWTQLVVGSTVYVGGSFTTATPAGGTSGGVARANMLAYDLKTGVLNTTFAPSFNAQVRGLAASPDGTTIYAVGDFTTVNGDAKNRLVALDATTGARVTSFAAKTNSAAWTVAATATTVYVGGAFTTANDVTRTRTAAFSASTGALLPWAPNVPDNVVRAMVVSPDGSKVALGGSFSSVNGSTSPGAGLAAVDGTTGANLPWAVGTKVYAKGTKASITSLTSDGTNVYGTAYVYGSTADGNLEGAFSAAWNGGTINWIEDCHGDTYSTGVLDGVLYTASHAHYCGNVPNGFDQSVASASASIHQRGLAFTTAATGTLLKNTYGSSSTYADFGGSPAPSLLTWYPTLTAGTFTGQDQAAWSVATAPGYILMGGEFPKVNGVAQTGLVRFATRSTATNLDGPQVAGTSWPLATTGAGSGTVRLSWQTNYDRDDSLLTYRVYRNGGSTPIATTTATSRGWWYRPWLSFTDTGLTPGASVTYRVKAFDPSGNAASTATVTAIAGATANGSTSGAYAGSVLADGAADYWRFDEPSGATTVLDRSGGLDLAAGTGVTLGQSDVLSGDTDTAATFSGTSSGLAASSSITDAPNTFTIEAWFKTSSTLGGKLVGFGDASSGLSATYDRHIYMDGSGRIYFGVYPNTIATVSSSTGFNNGKWHQVVASLSSAGMRLYVDGALVGSRTDVTQGQSYRGYWRVGGDSTWSGTSWFTGSIDDVALYPTAVTATQVANHYTIATTGAGNAAPTAAITATTSGLTASLDGTGSTDVDGAIASHAWTFGDGTSATGPTATHAYAAAGTYSVGLTVTDNGGLTATATKQVMVSAPNAPPTAKLTLAASGLTVTADSAGSADPDGSIASYAWNFGDGTTGSGATTTHVYATSGTYTVTLTVTDAAGATATVTGSATVADPTLAKDTFARATTNGLGSADTGGAWTIGTGASAFSVDPTAGAAFSTAAASTRSAYLNQVSSTSDVVDVTIVVPTVPTGGSLFAGVVGRRVGTDDYNARVAVAAGGTTQLQILRGTTTLLKSANLGVTVTAGSSIHLRVRTTGNGTTTLQASAWLTSGPAPSVWQVTTTDTTAGLQAAGSVGLRSYSGSGVTNGPLAVRFDDFEADSV